MSSSTSNDPFQYTASDAASTSRQPSPVLFDVNAEQHSGNYTTQMEELFNDESETHGGTDAEDDEDDEDEGFVYTGVDAPAIPTGYADQLRDVLGSEHTDDEMDTRGIEISSVHEEDDKTSNNNGAHEESFAQHTTSSLESITPVHMNTSGSGTSGVLRPFLPPGVSRLRSHTPQTLRSLSNEGGGNRLASNSHVPGGMSPSSSRFSSMSHLSSRYDFDLAGGQAYTTHSERDVFRWTDLSNISKQIHNPLTQKLSSVLGAPLLGVPTVMTANGLICIGTDQGKVCVFDFKQKLKCVCGNDVPGKPVGAVTAVALSHDHTYVACGHASGHIQLFDLKNPKVPARFVPPTTVEAVASGRKEGHIEGSRIISIDFIAERHTAIVSSDDHGLAFSHSLGKMLFIEAPDILRILGQYQSDANLQSPRPAGTISAVTIPDTSLPRRRRSRYTILATAPLPLGSPHATDSYNVIALLTPSKLVVVGLKPLPRTWFKCPRDPEEGFTSNSASKGRGTLAWSPSAQPSNSVSKSISHINKTTIPVLVFTWGCALRFIQVDESRSKEVSTNSRTGKQFEVEVGRIVYKDVGRSSTKDVILAVQWLNVHQIAVLTAQTLEVFDAQTLSFIESVSFDSFMLVSPSLPSTIDNAVSPVDSTGDIVHSIRVYKGKIFLLCKNEFRVGTLLTWADRILSFVEDGDFLSAINLTRSYYVGEAPGNTNGLPDDPVLRKETIGEKMKDLMVASVRYTFSEDRMRDGTHVTPDGRGVDRTSLFEDLVTTCCRASIALADFEFLFEDLFQRFDDTGISKIFLRQLEPFVLNNDLRYIPPRVAQGLVALHEEDGRPDRIEKIIWHIEPTCLDINQTIHLCQKHQLYDALIYVYTRALRDFVAPVVELLGLIRKVQQSRRLRFEPINSYDPDLDTEDQMDPTILKNAYKIYPYLSTVLSGLSYPSEEPLPDDDALRARKEVYAFVFLGCSGVWPSGEGSKLILTADEDGGAEPTYPYLRQLLRFDAESFLHSLDIAFEDPCLNDDDTQSINRLVIVRILLEIMAAGDLSPADSTLVNIFIARNVPKYPQFFTLMPPSTLHDILIRLADDPDLGTREDRQLAAEYLLSTYNPHDSDHIIHLFELAGFYRILRSWHRQEHRWGPLLAAYLDDNLRPSEVLSNVDEVLTINSRANKGSLSPDIHSTLTTFLPQIMASSLTDTAYLLEKHAPDLHETALQSLPEEHDQLTYLRRILGPPEQEQDTETSHSSNGATPPKVSARLCQLYISLECQQHPDNVIEALKYLPTEIVDWDSALLICEKERVYDAVVWATNRRGHPQEALQKAEAFQKRLTQRMVNAVLDPSASQTGELRRDLQSLVSIATIGVAICLEHSKDISKIHVPAEDIWFQLLSSQIRSVQALSSLRIETGLQKSGKDDAMATLRSLVQKTFSSLVSVATTQAVSFPRLFKRLVECAPPSMHAQYTEFRTILTGMLESYRSEGDMLVITKHLTDRDLFDTMAEVVRERDRGWAASQNSCSRCKKSFTSATVSISRSDANVSSASKIIVSRTGLVYHDTCSD